MLIIALASKNFTRFPNQFPLLTMAACKMKKRDGKMPPDNCARLMISIVEPTTSHYCPGGWALMKSTDTLFTCLISVYYILGDPGAVSWGERK